MARCPPSQDAGTPGDHQAEHVRQVMARVGQQRHRIADEAEHDLGHHEHGVEPDPDGEGPPETGRRMRVPQPAMGMAVAGMVVGAMLVRAMFVGAMLVSAVLVSVVVVIHGRFCD